MFQEQRTGSEGPQVDELVGTFQKSKEKAVAGADSGGLGASARPAGCTQDFTGEVQGEATKGQERSGLGGFIRHSGHCVESGSKEKRFESHRHGPEEMCGQSSWWT